MNPQLVKEVQEIMDQKSFSSFDIESDRDHMGDFDTFVDCFWHKILSLPKQPYDQAIVIRLHSMHQGKLVDDVFFYKESLGLRPIQTQFLKLYPNSIEI